MHIQRLLVWAGDGGVSQESLRVRNIRKNIEDKVFVY
jgi:hypothetical protein